MEAYKSYIASTGDLGAQNDLGVLYGRYGLSDLASEQLELPAKKGNISAMLNTANVQYTRKEFKKAKKTYKKVLKVDPENALAYLGIARCCYELEEYSECDLAYQKGCELDKSLAENYGYLGAFESTVGRAFNMADRLAYTVWPTEGSTGYKDVIDVEAEKKNEELLSLYGEAAKETIQKEQASVDFAKEHEMEPVELESRAYHPYVGLPSEISIFPMERALSLTLDLDEDDEAEDEKPQIEVSPAVEIPVFVAEEKQPEPPKAEEEPKPVPPKKVAKASKPTKKPKTAETQKPMPAVEKIPASEIQIQPVYERVFDDFSFEVPPQVPSELPFPESNAQSKSVKSKNTKSELKQDESVIVKSEKIANSELNILEKPKAESKKVAKAEPKTAEKKSRILEVPRLSVTGCYIQIGVFKDVKGFADVYTKYSKLYPIVALAKDGGNVMLAGPFGESEYISALEMFKSYGFTDAFPKYIMVK